MKLRREYLPATVAARQELVLLHGWGSNREIWRPLVAHLRPWANLTLLDIPNLDPGSGTGEPATLDEVLAGVVSAAPSSAVYVGWSLGGQLALALAARQPERVTAVVGLCSNPCFVARAGWPGMALDTYLGFCDDFTQNPEATLRRFDILQAQGSSSPRSRLRELRRLRADGDARCLKVGLRWLNELDQRQLTDSLSQPQLYLLAQEDGLVPAELLPLLERCPGVQAQALVGVGHLALWEAAGEVASKIQSFLHAAGCLQDPALAAHPLDKIDVAASFSRCAESYDSVASLQRDVGTRLLTSLDQLNSAPQRILDLGCGTGYFAALLRERFPDAHYLGLDIAQGMIEVARRRNQEYSGWLVADAESLPLAAGSVDLVFSSLAIQWCYQPRLLFAELARVLRPGGRCVFTSLGPETLCELRAAWAAVDQHQHVNTFLPAEALQVAAGELPELVLSLDAQNYSMSYPRVRDLFAELKGLGAHNVNRNRPSGLTGRAALQGMLNAYEDWRRDGLLPATYNVLFGVLEKS